MALRISAFIILFLSILFMPFWISAILALVCMAYFPFFIEAVLLFFLSDLLFGIREMKFHNILGISFIVALICFIILELIKNKLRLDQK